MARPQKQMPQKKMKSQEIAAKLNEIQKREAAKQPAQNAIVRWFQFRKNAFNMILTHDSIIRSTYRRITEHRISTLTLRLQKHIKRDRRETRRLIKLEARNVRRLQRGEAMDEPAIKETTANIAYALSRLQALQELGAKALRVPTILKRFLERQNQKSGPNLNDPALATVLP